MTLIRVLGAIALRVSVSLGFVSFPDDSPSPHCHMATGAGRDGAAAMEDPGCTPGEVEGGQGARDPTALMQTAFEHNLMLRRKALDDGEQLGNAELLPDDARVRYIGRFLVPPLFSLSEVAGNSCPEGLARITTEADCQVAAAAAGLPGLRYRGTETSESWPAGCYFCKDEDDCSDGTWFNKHSTGAANGGARTYCKGGESDGTRLFAWPGTQIVAQFHGTSVSAKLMGSFTGDRFVPIIDGEPKQAFITSKRHQGWKLYTLADGLPGGSHSVVLWKISEDLKESGLDGAARFGGFITDGQFLDLPAPRERRLEFIGDSDTVGYSAENIWGCEDPDSENNYKTWGAQIARALDADYIAEAISGYGVGAGGTDSVPEKLGRTCPFLPGYDWNFTAYVPDAVVILIGPNDQMGKEFNRKYKDMMNQIIENYANAAKRPKLIHVIGGSGNGFAPISRIKAVHDDVADSYFVPMGKAKWKMMNRGRNQRQYQGCDDSHYNEKGHAVVVSEVMPKIRDIMGWYTYSLTSPGNTCTGLSVKITSESKCKEAMEKATPGSTYWGQEKDGSWPSGCYYCKDVDGCEDGTWLNTHPTGNTNGGARPYCIA